MFANGITVTVTRSTAAGVDSYGDATFTTEDFTIEKCGVAPRTEGELVDGGRSGVIIGQTLFAPPGSVIRFDDLITIDGIVYEVDGEPGTWRSPFSGVERGVEVALRRVVG